MPVIKVKSTPFTAGLNIEKFQCSEGILPFRSERRYWQTPYIGWHIHFCYVVVAVHIVLVPTTCRNLNDTSTNHSCIEILNIFCERMAGYLTFISVISNFDSFIVCSDFPLSEHM